MVENSIFFIYVTYGVNTGTKMASTLHMLCILIMYMKNPQDIAYTINY